ncbi:MAG: ammonium transporter, partial [Desulfovibrio sp.]|nr:ammonium transporter [Desulfovibrio sp.]
VSVIATWGYVYLASRIILLLVDKTVGLRADPDEEAAGLDLNEHHERGYSL